MSNTLSASRSLAPRSVVWAAATLSGFALLATGGCSSDNSSPAAQAGTSSSGAAAGVYGGGSTAGSPGAAGSSVGATAGASSGGSSGVAGAMSGGGIAGAMSGGNGGSGPKQCVDTPPPPDPNWPGATCANWANETSECGADWFASYCDVSCKRCVPDGGTAGTGSGGGGGGSGGSGPAVDCTMLPNVTGGNGYATRYWDCCQTHCAQFDGHRCGQDGTTGTGSTQSACSGGDSFACYDEAPKAVSDCLSYGYIAKANPNCGGCYRIQFTGEGQYNGSDPGSRAIKGKQMIVKVSNTGGDVGDNQFDLMIPGGGVGQFNACSKQWGTSDLGAQYGGFLTNCTGTHTAKKECVRQQCAKIPAGSAREGCLWFVDWFQAADNPKFTSQPTDCPF